MLTVLRNHRVEISFPIASIPLCPVGSHKQSSYEEVAKSLGFIPAELIRNQLLEFFVAENIRLYDYNQVFAWLTKKRKQTKARRSSWCWRALREKDSINDYCWGGHKSIKVTFWGDGYYFSGQWSCRPYDRLVPMQVLQKVAKIEEIFGDRVKFLISDCLPYDTGIFIMVRPAMCDSGPQAEYSLVFDVWDDSSFIS